MKRTIVSLMCVLTACSTFAQGRLNFSNFASGVNGYVSEVPVNEGGTGLDLAGAGYMAVLYWAAGANRLETDLAPLLSTASATTGASPVAFGNTTIAGHQGYFIQSQPVFPPGQGAGTIITAQIRAWRVSDGATWDIASQVNGAHVGKGNTINVTLTVPTTPPPNMVGIQPFNLHIVPEPSTIALALLGGALLLFRRRSVTK